MNRPNSLLVIDDDLAFVSWLVECLEQEGYRVQGVTSATEALKLLESETIDLIISDVEMPGMRGVELLKRLQEHRPDQMILLMTAFGSIDLAVESLRGGAVDFLAKPFKLEALIFAIERVLRERHLRREVVRLRREVAGESSSGLAARSSAMKKVLDLARRAAQSDLPVLITGESGVGKGALAKFIHSSSLRAKKPFLQINCAALPVGLAESELFGARKGAFTDAKENRTGYFEQANEGILFLDEIGELPIEVQPKLLAALESRSIRPLGSNCDNLVDTRIVAATNRPLEEALRDRRFRPDLYHRLNVIRIEIPPLRGRVEDIDLIVDQVLARRGRQRDTHPIGISADALKMLRSYDWPGNVRELINALERAIALSEHDVLVKDDFTLSKPDTHTQWLMEALSDNLSLEAIEKQYISHVLKKTGGHKGKAAKILGLDRRTLYRKLDEMEPPFIGRTYSEDD